MDLANNIKTIHKKQNLMQKEVTLHISDKSIYSKIRKEFREIIALKQLDQEGKSTVFKFNDKILTKNLFFFNKNITTL